jgi:hypothetical protein
MTAQLAPSVLALIGSAPDGAERLVDVLAASPPWRRALLADLAETSKSGAGLARLYALLQNSDAPPSDDELRPVLDRLVENGRFDDAYLLWLNDLPADKLSSLGFLYNGHFDTPVTNLAFDWQISPVRGAKAEIAERAGRRWLDLSFFYGRVAFSHVRHWLALAPGRYALTGLGQSENLETELGLRWRVHCSDAPSGALATSELLKRTTPVHEFRVEFVVPPAGCAWQALVLELPARIPSDTQIAGVAHYANLAIERLPDVAKAQRD